LAGIFFAPKSGKELRSDLREKGSEVLKDAKESYNYWHFQIIPRLTTPAGFEMGSGIYIINVSLPEETAQFLTEGLFTKDASLHGCFYPKLPVIL
jgi:gas vesicle protein